MNPAVSNFKGCLSRYQRHWLKNCYFTVKRFWECVHVHSTHTTRTAQQTDTKLQSLNYPWTGMTFFLHVCYLGKKKKKEATFPERFLGTWLKSKRKKKQKTKQNKTKGGSKTHTNPAQVKQVEERRCESLLVVDLSLCSSSNH